MRRARSHQGELQQRQSAAPRRPWVLVADDNEDFRQLIAQKLRTVGYDVTEARTGAELLAQLNDALVSGERSARPDVIVSDVRMPGFFGLTILAGLRDEKWSTGIIVMTAYADRETRERVARLGAAAFFEKPFEVGDLIAAVRDVDPGRARGALAR